jgi:hypothetical protein
MQVKKNIIIGLCSFLVSLGQVGISSTLNPSEVHTSAGISYMSGGIGEDELADLTQLGQAYNLKLIFADTGGHYLSDVSVGITDERGHQVLAAVSDGPWFFANLPAGRYHVLATTQGYTREQVVQISPQHQARLAFFWTEPGSRFAKRE